MPVNIYLIFHLILNVYAFSFGNPLEINFTYIMNQLQHTLYVMVWALSTLGGLYFFAKQIWESYSFPYNKKLHLVTLLLPLLGALFPYSFDQLWTNDFHVWIIIVGVFIYFMEWIRFFGLCVTCNQKFRRLFYFNALVNMVIVFIFGHISLLSQVYFSCSMILLLAYFQKQLTGPHS